ncbi:protein CHUP1, chloroplastic [Tanacetum coccineum]
MSIEEAKDLATLLLDELIGNLNVYEMVLDIDGCSQDGSDEDEEINLMAKNFKRLSRKGVTVHDKFNICKVKTKGSESSRRERGCYNCGNKNHLAHKCPKPNNKAFVGVTWSDSEDDHEPQNDATCLMAIDSQEFSKYFSKTYEKLLQEKLALEKEHSKLFCKVNELELEVKELASNEEAIKPCQKCVELTQEVDSLKSNVSKLQDEALNLSKFKKSSIVLDDMLSRQKLYQDKEGIGFSKNGKTTFVLKHPLEEWKQHTKDIARALIMDLDTHNLELILDIFFLDVSLYVDKEVFSLRDWHRSPASPTCSLNQLQGYVIIYDRDGNG